MGLRRRDAHLGAQTQLPAIIESGGRVPQDARGVHFLEEALGTLSILGNDRRGMPGSVLGNVGQCVVQGRHRAPREDSREKFHAVVLSVIDYSSTSPLHRPYSP